MRTLFGSSKSMAPIHTMTVRTCTYTARTYTTALQASDCRPGQNGIAWKADRIAPSLIQKMVARLRDGYDLVIASRYRAGSEVHGVLTYRRFLSDADRLVFQGFYPIPGVRDYTCCFRAFGMSILRRARAVYGEELCTARGFEAVMDLLLRLGTLDVRATEIGFVLHYGDRVGQSKMKVIRTIGQTVKLLARRRVERPFPGGRQGIATSGHPGRRTKVPLAQSTSLFRTAT